MRSALAALALLVVHGAAQAQSLAPSPIGYSTVSEALQALRSQPGMEVTTTKPDGWIIAHDPRSFVLWSFTPPGHYAHPTAVRRQVRESGSDVSIDMSVLCESQKANCDKLTAEFEQLNAAMRDDIRRRK